VLFTKDPRACTDASLRPGASWENTGIEIRAAPTRSTAQFLRTNILFVSFSLKAVTSASIDERKAALVLTVRP
jgi:hypothetical protein